MRTEQEVEEAIGLIVKERKTYLKEHGGSGYSATLGHWVVALEYVLNKREFKRSQSGTLWISKDCVKEQA